MKIIIVLLIIILITILLGPIVGVLMAIAAGAIFIPGIGNAIGGIIVIGTLSYFFGAPAAIFGVLGLLGLLYLYTLYEKSQIEKEINKISHGNTVAIQEYTNSDKAEFETIELSGRDLIADGVHYPVEDIKITWQQERLKLYDRGKLIGTVVKTRDEFKELNNSIALVK